MKIDIPYKWRPPKAEIATVIAEKEDLKPKLIIRDTEIRLIVVKRTIQQNIMIANTYAPNIGVPNCIKQTLHKLKTQIDISTIILGDFNTSLTTIKRSSIHFLVKML